MTKQEAVNHLLAGIREDILLRNKPNNNWTPDFWPNLVRAMGDLSTYGRGRGNSHSAVRSLSGRAILEEAVKQFEAMGNQIPSAAIERIKLASQYRKATTLNTARESLHSKFGDNFPNRGIVKFKNMSAEPGQWLPVRGDNDGQ
ncbi:MAG: hypothetical protein FWC51_04660 [Proteobacteria bacterium]|nr:hypothetical protein [Pseudomonadota bacterium]